MDGTIRWCMVTSSSFVAVFGDFSNYVIADRIGLTVELIPHLFHTANNRPSGSRGWYAYYRVGADSVNDSAFRHLDMRSTACPVSSKGLAGGYLHIGSAHTAKLTD